LYNSTVPEEGYTPLPEFVHVTNVDKLGHVTFPHGQVPLIGALCWPKRSVNNTRTRVGTHNGFYVFGAQTVRVGIQGGIEWCGYRLNSVPQSVEAHSEEICRIGRAVHELLGPANPAMPDSGDGMDWFFCESTKCSPYMQPLEDHQVPQCNPPRPAVEASDLCEPPCWPCGTPGILPEVPDNTNPPCAQ